MQHFRTALCSYAELILAGDADAIWFAESHSRNTGYRRSSATAELFTESRLIADRCRRFFVFENNLIEEDVDALMDPCAKQQTAKNNV